VHAVHDRSTEVGTSLGQKVESVRDRVLLADGQAVPPLHELIRDLDFPRHQSITFSSL